MIIISNTPKLEKIINSISKEIGEQNKIIIKRFIIGKGNSVNAASIYISQIANKTIIARDVLKPLMTNVEENIFNYENISEHLCEKYIYMSDTYVEKDINKVVGSIKKGKTVIVVDGALDFIIVDTTNIATRGIAEPTNEAAIRGSKEGFVENLQINLGMIKKHIKDKNLITEIITLGARTQTDIAILYIDDIVDKDIVNDIRNKVSSINIDSVQGTGIIEQLIEKYPYTVFPQMLSTERLDRVVANLMDARIVVMLDGTPFTIIVPAIFPDFFQAIEDYYQRSIVSSFIRLLRVIAVIIVITLPSIYLVFIRFNAELIPIKLLIPIIQSRKGIPFPPILEILSMEIVIEFLREGGLRLPSKIGQTLSVVGGFIIGSAAISAKIVSPTTVVVVGVAAIGTFVIPNYDMALSIRIIRFPILIISNLLGSLGIIACIYMLMVHLYSLDSFGVPYFASNKYSDFKNTLVRVPLSKINKRSESIPNNNPVKQTDSKKISK